MSLASSFCKYFTLVGKQSTCLIHLQLLTKTFTLCRTNFYVHIRTWRGILYQPSPTTSCLAFITICHSQCLCGLLPLLPLFVCPPVSLLLHCYRLPFCTHEPLFLWQLCTISVLSTKGIMWQMGGRRGSSVHCGDEFMLGFYWADTHVHI